MHRYTDCIVPDGGYPTQDGYLRVLSRPRKLGGKLKMLHRLEWEKVYGTIPEGYEVDHRCKNRECQNVNHMQLLPSSKHRAKDNIERSILATLEILSWIVNNPGKSPKDVAKSLSITRGRVEQYAREYPEIRKFLANRRSVDLTQVTH